jgi:hypothetical protein
MKAWLLVRQGHSEGTRRGTGRQGGESTSHESALERAGGRWVVLHLLRTCEEPPQCLGQGEEALGSSGRTARDRS